MSRRRYVSTEISLDTRVNRLALAGGDFAAMLYTWMIPHAADDGSLPADPEALMFMVIPGRRDKSVEDVAAALAAMRDQGLIEWEDGVLRFPATAFYRYQTYIQEGKRRGANQQETAQDSDSSADQRESAQNAASRASRASPSPSPSPSLSPSPSVSPSGEKTSRGPAREADEPPAVAKPLSERQIKHRAMFGALSASFGPPTPGPEHERYETAAKQLVTAGADPAEIPHLIEAWTWINPGTARVNSLAANLTPLRKASPPAANGRASPNGHFLSREERQEISSLREFGTPEQKAYLASSAQNVDLERLRALGVLHVNHG